MRLSAITLSKIALALVATIALPALAEESDSDRIEFRSFHSQALEKDVPFAVIIPNSDPTAEGWPTLFLLHGRGRNHLSLIDDPQSRAELLHQPYLIALPYGFDGWYINSPVDSSSKYGDAFKELETLIAHDYPVQKNRNSRAIIGWSMGGFGTLYHATYRPDQYAFAGAIIGLLDFPRRDGLPENQRYDIPESIFGSDPNTWRNFNPRLQIDALRNTRVFLVIGEQAFDRTMNENFLQDARQASVDITAVRLSHSHTFEAVQEGLPLVLDEVREHFVKVGALSLP